MRVFLVVCLTLGLALTGAPAAAQDTEALRRELEQLRQQFKTMQEQYQKAIDSLTERLQRLEAQPATAPPQPSAAAATPAAPPPRVGMPSLVELARPHEPFALSERRGAGQLLFDMGVTGDFAGSLTSNRVEREHLGSLAGEENRFFPREIEVSLFGQIDPYARAEVRFEAGDELEANGSRSFTLSLAEANVTLMTLPFGTQLKMGRERLRFGYLNELHQHDRPFIDNPNVLVRFFGDEGLVENGAELSWVPPLPVYLQAIMGVFDGDNEDAFGRGSLRDPLLTARLRTFFELGETSALQLGGNNPRLVTGGIGRVDASIGIPVLEVPTGRVDRSMGDVHPSGNPHYTLDPGMAPIITANLVEGLARVAPDQRVTFEQNRQAFLGRLEPALARWTQTVAPLKGAKVVVNHNLWLYFLTRFGLTLAGTVEERPGIPPSPAHIARLIGQMKADGVKALVLEPWGDRRLAERLAAETGAKVVLLAPAVGALKGTDSYIEWIDFNVATLAQAMR